MFHTSITRQRFKQFRTWVLLTSHLSVSGLSNTLCYPWWNHSCNMSQMIINHKILWHINLVQCLARRRFFPEYNLYNLSCISSFLWSKYKTNAPMQAKTDFLVSIDTSHQSIFLGDHICHVNIARFIKKSEFCSNKLTSAFKLSQSLTWLLKGSSTVPAGERAHTNDTN
jgi:hypothetical protein